MKKALFALFLTLAAAPARADTVILRGGGSLEGKVVSSTDRQVVIDTSQGRVQIDADRVSRIDYGQGGAAPPPAAPPAQYAPPPQYSAPPPRYGRRRRQEWEPVFEPRQQSISLDFGLAAPLSGVDFSAIGGGTANNGDVGPLVGLQYLYFPSPGVGVGLEYNYYNRSTNDTPNLVPNSFGHIFGDSSIFLADLKLSMTNQGTARPYLLVAAGGHYTTTTIDSQPAPGFSWSDTGTNEPRRIVDGGGWGPAISLRLGLDFGFADPGVFAIEAGWTGLANAGLQPTTQGSALGLSGSSGMLNFFTFAGRWGWTF